MGPNMGNYENISSLLAAVTSLFTDKSSLTSETTQSICSWIETNFSTEDEVEIPVEIQAYVFIHKRISKYEVVIKVPNYQYFTIVKTSSDTYLIDEYKEPSGNVYNHLI